MVGYRRFLFSKLCYQYTYLQGCAAMYLSQIAEVCNSNIEDNSYFRLININNEL